MDSVIGYYFSLICCKLVVYPWDGIRNWAVGHSWVKKVPDISHCHVSTHLKLGRIIQICWWILNSERILLIGQHLLKLWAKVYWFIFWLDVADGPLFVAPCVKDFGWFCHGTVLLMMTPQFASNFSVCWCRRRATVVSGNGWVVTSSLSWYPSTGKCSVVKAVAMPTRYSTDVHIASRRPFCFLKTTHTYER